MFRSIERHKPTLLIDKADTFLADAEGLRGILNSGHTQGMAYVMRSVGKDFEPRQFSTWAPMAMAKIGRFPRTLEELSIMIRMQKRRPDKEIKRFRRDRIAGLKKLTRKAARWGEDHIDVLRQADPTMLKGLSDRAADNWRPLFAIADAAGGHWPETARHVALQLSENLEDPLPEVQLLADSRAAFEARRVDRLSSEALGKEVGLKPHHLARQLQPFGIRPRVIRIGDKTPRGYLLADFEDTFAAYLPPQNATPQQSNEVNNLGSSRSATGADDVADE